MLCLCCVMCYVIKVLCKKELVILGIVPNFGLSNLRSNSKILETD